jgi:hypothetical protein
MARPASGFDYFDAALVLLSMWGLMWPWRVTSTSLPHLGHIADRVAA